MDVSRDCVSAVRLRRSSLILSVSVPEDDINESGFHQNEDNGAEQKQAVPEEIYLPSEIRLRFESGVGMRFVAGDRHDHGDNSVGCKPPKAVRTFHAKEILFSSSWSVSPSPGEAPADFPG